jgi:hypothetical protein
VISPEIRKVTNRFFFARLLSLGMLFSSCQSPNGTAGFIDPVFAYAVPSSARLFASEVRSVTILPDEGTSAALYASLKESSPRVVLLSPLLASEIDTILSMDESKTVAIFGEGTRKIRSRLYSAEFSSIEAARLAGSAMATAEKTLESGTLVCALFAGASLDGSRKAATAFSEAYAASGGDENPLIEMVEEGFSQELAKKLASLDIGTAYVSTPLESTERWIREAFDSHAFIMAELPLPSERHQTLADALVIWDISSTLRLLFAGIENGNNERIAGAWKIERNENNNGRDKR